MVGENETIDIPGPSDVGVLLLHGLYGTPNELHVLGGTLARAGYRVRIPLLPGRGASWDDLDRLSWDDVLDAALRHHEELAREHEHVVVGGLSAGATLALDIALRRPAAALLLYACALAIRSRIAYLSPYVWRLVRRWPPRAPVAERFPVRAAGELVRAMTRVRSQLGRITAPALVVHARHDPMISSSSALLLQRELGGEVLLHLRDSAVHAITAGPDREEIGELTLEYLRARAPLRPPRPA